MKKSNFSLCLYYIKNILYKVIYLIDGRIQEQLLILELKISKNKILSNIISNL